MTQFIYPDPTYVFSYPNIQIFNYIDCFYDSLRFGYNDNNIDLSFSDIMYILDFVNINRVFRLLFIKWNNNFQRLTFKQQKKLVDKIVSLQHIDSLVFTCNSSYTSTISEGKIIAKIIRKIKISEFTIQDMKVTTKNFSPIIRAIPFTKLEKLDLSDIVLYENITPFIQALWQNRTITNVDLSIMDEYAITQKFHRYDIFLNASIRAIIIKNICMQNEKYKKTHSQRIAIALVLADLSNYIVQDSMIFNRIVDILIGSDVIRTKAYNVDEVYYSGYTNGFVEEYIDQQDLNLNNVLYDAEYDVIYPQNYIGYRGQDAIHEDEDIVYHYDEIY